MAWIAGVDGCKGGWIAVYEDTESGELECRVAVCDRKAKHTDHDPSCAFEAVMAHHAPLAAVAVDMPIGLCDDKVGRACDRAAREVLGKRSSSIFSAPAAGVLDLFCKMSLEERKDPRAYDCANKRNRERTGEGNEKNGKGLSRQSWALVPKIAEVARYLDGQAGGVHEVHPEVSFAAMNVQRGSPSKPLCLSKGHEMRHPKKTLAGLVERRVLLKHKEVFENRFEELEARAAEFDPAGRAALDDFYDALACLWTARRIRERTALALPGRNPVGSMSLPMRIVY